MRELSIDAFNNFECIGSLCEDHCCKEWVISIDKSTYKKYEKEKNKEFKEVFKNGVVKVKDGGKHNYAVINLKNDNTCPFLDNKRLCSIYKIMGSKNMCHTCKVYPRYSAQVGDIIQKTISLSCPEACRKVLLREEPIEFNLKEVNPANEITINKIVTFKKKECFPEKLFFELRAFTIDLLQNRKFSIEERLIILGLFIEDINNEDEQVILEVIKKYLNDISQDNYKNIANYFDKKNMLDKEIKYSIKAYLKVISKFKHSKLKENMINMKDGLKIDENSSYEDIRKNYSYIKDEYYSPFIKNYEYVFENYLVNYIFQNIMMHSTDNLFENYAEMLVYYSMIKFTLIGVCGNFKEDMNESNLTMTISTFLRGIEHSNTQKEALRGLVEEFELKCLSNLMPLILM